MLVHSTLTKVITDEII